MTPTNRFVLDRQRRLRWKFVKHGLGVMFMMTEREGNQKPLPKRENVFLKYLGSFEEPTIRR